MILIQVAHRLEAKDFFDYFHLKILNCDQVSLYRSIELQIYLLISGEGLQKAFESLTFALSFLKYKEYQMPTLILNLGIVGAISNKLKIEDMISPKLVIGVDEHCNPFFNTHELSSLKNLPDVYLFSSAMRIQKKEQKEKLNILGAEIVDRELWGICQSAKSFQIPVQSLKIVSDLSETAVCDIVLSKTNVFSNKLFQFFSQNFLQSKPSLKEKTFIPDIFSNQAFHFTQTQKHQVLKMYELLAIKDHQTEEELLKTIKTQELESLEILPKQRSRDLLLRLKAFKNPIMSEWLHKVEEISFQAKKSKINISFDHPTEITEINFDFSCKSYKEYQKMLKALDTKINEKIFQTILFEENT